MEQKEPVHKKQKSQSTHNKPVILHDTPFFPEFQLELERVTRCVSWEECFGYPAHTDKQTADAILEGEDEKERTERNDVRSQIVGIITNLHPTVSALHMDLLPSLKVISNNGVGIEHINIKDAHSRKISVSNTPGCLQSTTADLAWGLLLAGARNIVQADHVSRASSTTHFDPNWWGKEVSGSVVGIVGMGAIGKEIAKRAVGFDMKILYTSRTRKSYDDECVLGVQAVYVALEDLLRQADFVVLCCPATSETNHLINKTAIKLMKKDSLLVNIARGSVVDQDALVEACRAGAIGGAALDVTTPEPLPRDHALFSLSNVIISPHIGSATKVARKKMFDLALENLLRGCRGESLLSPVSAL